MATYRAIKGINLQTIAGDPSNLALGDIWYSSTARKIRVGKTTAGAWASGGALNSIRYRFPGGFGTYTAGTVIGGLGYPGYAVSALVEEYDGSAWTEVTNRPISKADAVSTGTQTAGLTVGGLPLTAQVDEYDGTNWTAGGAYPQTNSRTGLCGTQTAALSTGGGNPTYNTESYEYDGSSWTAGGDYPHASGNVCMSGTQTAGFAFGGYDPSNPDGSVDCNSYDGSSWTETADLNSARGESGYSVSGTQALSLVVGGSSPASITEVWDGSSWTEVADLSAGRGAGGAIGTGANMVYAGGSPVQATTEEWTGEYVAAASVTSS